MIEYRMDEIFELQMGKTPSRGKQEYWVSKGNKWISIADLSKCGKYISETKEYLSDEAVNESGISLIPANTVLLSFKLSIGKVAITAEPMYSNEAIMSFRDRQVVELLPEYIYYMFLGKDWDSGTNKAVMGKTLNKATLSAIRIKVHDISKQWEIVRVLSKVDELIVARQQQLAKLDELVKARFVEMFGDPMINSMHWPIYELSEYIQFLTSGSRGWAKYFTDVGEYFITIKNVKNCKITLDDVQHIAPPDNAEAKRTKVQAGDLLISITADLGRTGVVTQEIAEHGAYINQHLTCIRLNQSVVLPLYVAYYMESDAGKKQFQLKNQTGVKAGLNFNSINTLKVMVPPLEKQRSFVSFVEQVEKTKSSIQKNLKKIEILKKALVQRYFG